MYAAPAVDPTESAGSRTRALARAWRAGEITVAEVIARSRDLQYSLRMEERAEVVRLLAGIAHSDAARELVTLYRECEWRDTRLAIVREMGRQASQRAMEFLMKVAEEREDLPLCEAAVTALGATRQPLAARFLANLFRHGPEVLRPTIVAAVAAVPDRALIPDFLVALPRAAREDDQLLARRLVDALMELRVSSAVPALVDLYGQTLSPVLRGHVIQALARLCRDPSWLELLDARDPAEEELIRRARAEVERSGCWSIEDYLCKHFRELAYAPSIAMELAGFPGDEVAAGLELFDGPGHRARRISLLAVLDHDAVFDAFLALADEDLGDAEVDALLRSLAAHTDERAVAVLHRLASRCLADPARPLFARWMGTLAVVAPRADEEFARIFTSERYASLSTAARVVVYNELANFGLAGAPDGRVPRRVATLLEQRLLLEPEPHVQGRVLRAMAQVGVCGPRVLSFVEANLTKPALLGSALRLVEGVAPRGGVMVLLTCLKQSALARRHCAGILRALRAQPTTLKADNPELDALLAWALDPGSPPEDQLSALRCLAVHPRPAHARAVTSFLAGGEERHQLAAILALKAMNLASNADVLAPLLDAASEAVVGRVIDALAVTAGPRPPRLLLDVLERHFENLSFADKILRAFPVPTGARDDLLARVEALLQRRPDHPSTERLYNLRDRLLPVGAESDPTLGAEVPRLDAVLARHLPGYAHLDEQVKVALRAAELPFSRPELYRGQLDKSTAVLGYCKAIDLFLGAALGERLLLPRMHRDLYGFQRLVHTAGLADPQPSHARVSAYFDLGDSFAGVGSPVPKMSLVAQSVLSGKILMGDQWKVLDGLRAWAVVLILFCADVPAGGPRGPGSRAPVRLEVERTRLLDIAARLFRLQDIRNPVAHRQTLLSFTAIDRARTEAIEVLNLLGDALR
jgi:hypothetical protein